MIVTDVFFDDTNKNLKYAQHDAYFQSVTSIFKAARERIVNAARLLEVELPFVEKLLDIETFDHRVLQDAHDILAAVYRLKATQFSSTNQASLDDWLAWLRAEIKFLTEHDHFTRSVTNAVLFENSDLGSAAEEDLGRFLVQRYKLNEWELSYSKVYAAIDTDET